MSVILAPLREGRSISGAELSMSDCHLSSAEGLVVVSFDGPAQVRHFRRWVPRRRFQQRPLECQTKQAQEGRGARHLEFPDDQFSSAKQVLGLSTGSPNSPFHLAH